MLLVKHVSQSLMQRKQLMNVSGDVGYDGDNDSDDDGDGDDYYDNDIMPIEDFRKLFWEMLSSVTRNLKLFFCFAISHKTMWKPISFSVKHL